MPDKSTIVREAAAFRQRMIPAKVAVDECLAEMGRLLAQTSSSSVTAGLPSYVAQPTLNALGSAIAGAIAVRENLIVAHGAAGAAGRRLIPELAWGTPEDTEPTGYQASPVVPAPTLVTA